MRYLYAGLLTVGAVMVAGAVFVALDSRGYLNFLRGTRAV